MMDASKPITTIGASFLRKNKPCDIPLLFQRSKTRCRTTSSNCSYYYYNNNNSKIVQRRFLSSSKQTKGKSKKNKKPKLSGSNSTSGGSVQTQWCTSTRGLASSSSSSSQQLQLEMGKYGLKRLDYTTMKPPVWTTPPHPPTKTAAERLVFPLSIVLVAGIVLWVYMSPEEDDMTEYWKRVESGQILLDDDDEYDDDDEEEEEE